MTIKLPRYVVRIERPHSAGPRQDFYFQIPKRLRPEGWNASIRLPVSERERRRDGSAAELAAVERDARRLNDDLDALRKGVETFPTGSIPWLWAEWRKRPSWQALTPKTQSFYLGGYKHLETWWRAQPFTHQHARALSWPVIVRLMSCYDKQRGVHRQIRGCLQRLLSLAEDLGHIPRSPFVGKENYRWQIAKSTYTVEIWEIEHVRRAVKICDDAGRRSVGTAILMGYDLMQYPKMLSTFRRGEHYDPTTGEFIYNRDKTGEPARVRVMSELHERLKDCGLYLLINENTGRPYDDPRILVKSFRRLMKVDPALATFEMRWLRHSGVFEARRAGLDLETIADIGAWKSAAAVQAVIDRHYRVPDGVLASRGQAARELLRNKKFDTSV